MLQLLQFLGQPANWLDDHSGVVKEHVHRAERDRLIQEEIGAQRQGSRAPDRPDGLVRVPEDAGGQAGPHLFAQPRARQLVEPAQDVGLRVGGADVFRARQPLFQETEHIGADLAPCPPIGDGDVPQQQQDGHAEQYKQRKGQAGPPLLPKEQHQDAHQEQATPHDLDRERGEEGPQVVHVAVNALDHFAGRVLVMERHIQG